MNEKIRSKEVRLIDENGNDMKVNVEDFIVY